MGPSLYNELCTKNQKFPDDPFHHTYVIKFSRRAVELQLQNLRRNAHGLHHRHVQNFANATLRAAVQLHLTIAVMQRTTMGLSQEQHCLK